MQSDFEHIINISTVNMVIVKNRFVYSIHISIPKTEAYGIRHTIPILKQDNSVFFAIIPDYEYLLMGQANSTYVPTDKTSLDECRLYGQIKMRKGIQLTYLMSGTYSCENIGSIT